MFDHVMYIVSCFISQNFPQLDLETGLGEYKVVLSAIDRNFFCNTATMRLGF